MNSINTSISTSTERFTTQMTTEQDSTLDSHVQQLAHVKSEFQESCSPHMNELINIKNLYTTSSTSYLQSSKLSVPYSLLLYILRAIKSFLTTILFSPFTFFQDPLSTLVALVIYPIVFIGLWCMMVILYFSSLLGGAKFIEWLSNKYSFGFSPVNWSNPFIFGSESIPIMKAAKTILTGERTTYPDVPVPGKEEYDTHTLRIFSIDLSLALLLFSSIVYERKDTKVLEASELMSSAATKPEGSIGKLEDLRKAKEALWDSESVIREHAKKWGTRFEVVSELASISGPFASVFYNAEGESPFIVLVFKGTGLSNFAEFLVDASFIRITAEVFLGDGAAHQGFYTDLFPTSNGGSDGYETILRNLHRIASTLRSSSGLDPSIPIPLWITGHSLGSALASLTHFRLLYSPTDLSFSPSSSSNSNHNQSNLILRDSYQYGTPRIGDGTFASKFTSLSLQPLNRPSILWRIIDALDVVTHLPPGLADDELIRESMLKGSTLDYSHIGIGVQLTDSEFNSEGEKNGGVEGWKGEEELSGGFYTETRVGFGRVGKEIKEGKGEGEEEETVLMNVLKVLPIPRALEDHFPAYYFARLNRIKPTMKETSEGVWINIVSEPVAVGNEKVERGI